MSLSTPTTLISTVGTSLFFPNLKGLTPGDPDPLRAALAEAYAARDWAKVAGGLGALDATDRLCGAEINSLASLFEQGYAASGANLFFCHSATDDGRAIGGILAEFYRRRGHPHVQACEIEDLQDTDPRRFRTRGLRNLTKTVCKIIREYGAGACAINATGGYKAQIAIAVMLGQALGVPVYYKHERFNEIIPFPPMPVALDFGVWLRTGGVLAVLEREIQPALVLDDCPDDAEILESLVERTEIDGTAYFELSPAGQIFHETFRERFQSVRDQVLPPVVPTSQKQAPFLGDHGVINRNKTALARFLGRITDEVHQVSQCRTTYCNPDLPEPIRFRARGDDVEGIWSNGSETVKFVVETSANTPGQRDAVLAALNEWLETATK